MRLFLIDQQDMAPVSAPPIFFSLARDHSGGKRRVGICTVTARGYWLLRSKPEPRRHSGQRNNGADEPKPSITRLLWWPPSHVTLSRGSEAARKSPWIAQFVRCKNFTTRGVYRVELLTVGADYRLARVALVRAPVFDERINFPSTIGAAVTELGHVAFTILERRRGCDRAGLRAGEGKRSDPRGH